MGTVTVGPNPFTVRVDKFTLAPQISRTFIFSSGGTIKLDQTPPTGSP